MALRIGIDVGGTFTHGVALQPPGSVIATARTPTTHSDPRGVAAGIAEVLRLLLAELEQVGHSTAEIELVAHSTTQATNALLEGDLAGVHLMALAPPGERGLVGRALAQRYLDIGGGHRIRLWPKLMEDWRKATGEEYPSQLEGGRPCAPPGAATTAGWARGPAPSRPEMDGALASIPVSTRAGFDSYGVPSGFWVSAELPVAVVQPLAGRHELREHAVAAHYRACGHPTVAAGDITQVLGLAARTRTAVVNAAMLPTMLATAEYTEKVVRELLPGVPLQVVRSDGGAMTIDEMRRQPIQSLLSGPAAGASAALHRSGLSDAVFIEVGGTSTDITLIKDGRVRHRYATVGGQRLMVPALDLRTVAVGGGSMLRADKPLFGPRSAHIAGLPYLFQALAAGKRVTGAELWQEADDEAPYVVTRMDDGSVAAYTLTDYTLLSGPQGRGTTLARAKSELGVDLTEEQIEGIRQGAFACATALKWKRTGTALKAQQKIEKAFKENSGGQLSSAQVRQLDLVEGVSKISDAYEATCKIVVREIHELAEGYKQTATPTLVGGGGGAPVIGKMVAVLLGHEDYRLIDDHSVISAIGAALAVTCVSLSRNVAQPTGGDIAELIAEVEARLAAQGAERVATDYEYDPRRQVLTVTGRGSRPYEQDTQPRSLEQQQDIARNVLKADPALEWQDDGTSLWISETAGSRKRPSASWACANDRFGRVLWQGRIAASEPAAAGRIGEALERVTARHTQHTDGGAVLPQLGLLTGGRYIPLDQLGSAELIAEVLRWEKLPETAQGCFIVGR